MPTPHGCRDEKDYIPCSANKQKQQKNDYITFLCTIIYLLLFVPIGT